MPNLMLPENNVDIRTDKEDVDGKSDESTSSKQITVTIDSTKSKVKFTHVNVPD